MLLPGLLVLYSVLCIYKVSSFNLDTGHITAFRGPTNSMFGFTVAQHIENGRSWVVVGAPLATTRLSTVHQGGSVFRCPYNKADTCFEIAFDIMGDTYDHGKGKTIDIKSGQWLGASLHSTGKDGPLVACAPRYTTTKHNVNTRSPIGRCFVASPDFSEFVEFSPCRKDSHAFMHRNCQAGLGVALSKDGQLYVGAPGSTYWQGQVFSYSPFANPELPVHSTPELTMENDDSYLGYSLAVGNFSGHGDHDVAVGLPRGAQLRGKVQIYKRNLEKMYDIAGEQLGSYFSYCLCAADVDGDGLDDLIVGAPMFSNQNAPEQYENGRVYVIYQGLNEPKFRVKSALDGLNSKARFGLSLTSLGDMNLDGFDDFAVGAPYDGPLGRGAVYIYNGASDGVHNNPSQVIHAEDVLFMHIRTFGFSVSGGQDLDGNGYTDLVIGAYASDAAFVIKSRPVARIKTSLNVDSNLISLGDENCSPSNGQQAACTTIRFCFELQDNAISTMDVEMQINLDSEKDSRYSRLLFTNTTTSNVMRTIRISRLSQFCDQMDVYLQEYIEDKLTPIVVKLKYKQKEVHRVMTAVVEPNTRDHSVNIKIKNNCGTDNICTPDLRLMATVTPNELPNGSVRPIEVNVTVNNDGEDSFGSTFTITLPAGVVFTKMQHIDPAAFEALCRVSHNDKIICDIGNPLPTNGTVHFKLFLRPYPTATNFDFKMEATSVNPEGNTTLEDNIIHVSIPKINSHSNDDV